MSSEKTAKLLLLRLRFCRYIMVEVRLQTRFVIVREVTLSKPAQFVDGDMP